MRKRILFLTISIFIFSVALFAENAVDYYRNGKSAEAAGDFYQAIEMYKSSLIKNPDFSDSISGLAHSYYGLEEYEEALKYAEQAEKYDYKNTDIMNLKARIHLNLGNLLSAEEIFQSVLDIEENNIEAEFGLAELDIASGRVYMAENRFENALLVSPESRKALLSLVLINDNAGFHRKAEYYLRQALKYYSDNSYVQYTAANHFFSENKIDESLFHLKTALFLQPDFPEASILLFRIYMDLGKYHDAVAEIEKILSDNSDDYLLWYLLGRSYEKLGSSEKAVNAWARNLNIKPDDDLTRIALENEIIEKYPMEHRLREYYSAYHLELGAKYEAMNMLDKSVDEYRRALKINPYSLEGRLLYADVLKRFGYIERYLLILSGIVEEGNKSVDIMDEIEIRKSMLDRTLSEEWDTDQFTVDKNRVPISLFFSGKNMNHHEGDHIISEYIEYLLNGFENIEIRSNDVSDDFADCFRNSRETDSDYFIMFEIEESERVFSLKSDIYLADTGNLLKSISSVRTGNQMLPEAGRAAAAEIHGLFPVYGRIINRKFDIAAVNIGMKDGISVGEVFDVIKKGSLSKSRDSFGFIYDENNLLGSFTITQADELISEGTLEVSGFFDMINPGDLVLRKVRDEEENIPDDTSNEQLFIRGELFKSITNIQ